MTSLLQLIVAQFVEIVLAIEQLLLSLLLLRDCCKAIDCGADAL
jgi:hypothetical protein